MGTNLREGTAAEAGLSERRLDHIRDLAAGWVSDGIHPALGILVARHGVIALHEAYGRLGPEPSDPALPRDALWPLASLGKPITATALMMLVEEGRVGLTRPVREYIPEFAGGPKDGVQVHQLLTHTSGLEGAMMASDEGIALYMDPMVDGPKDPSLHPVVDRLLQAAYASPLRAEPGKEMFYESLNYELVAEIVRRVSGRSVVEYYQDRIFGPLGMADTYMAVPAESAGRVVRVKAEGLMAFAWDMPLATIPAGGSGGCSTVRDMAVFGQAFLDGGSGGSERILAPSTVRDMVTNQIPGVPGVLAILERHDEASWGYGWGVACHEKWSGFPTHAPGTFSHAGATGTYLWCDPATDVVGVFFGPMATAGADGMPRWQADFFVNAVTAAVE